MPEKDLFIDQLSNVEPRGEGHKDELSAEDEKKEGLRIEERPTEAMTIEPELPSVPSRFLAEFGGFDQGSDTEIQEWLDFAANPLVYADIWPLWQISHVRSLHSQSPEAMDEYFERQKRYAIVIDLALNQKITREMYVNANEQEKADLDTLFYHHLAGVAAMLHPGNPDRSLLEKCINENKIDDFFWEKVNMILETESRLTISPHRAASSLTKEEIISRLDPNFPGKDRLRLGTK